MNDIDKQLNPWQQRNQLGVWPALRDTVKQILVDRDSFFKNLVIKDSYLEPFLFYFLVNATATTLAFLFELLWRKIALGSEGLAEIVPSSRNIIAVFVISILLAFLRIVVGIFVISLMTHLMVLLFKGERKFLATFNIIAYSAPANLFAIIHGVVGEVAVFVFALVIITSGLKHIQNFSTKKAVVVYLCSIILLSVPSVAITTIPRVKAMKKAVEEANKVLTEIDERTVQTTFLSSALKLYEMDNGTYPTTKQGLKALQEKPIISPIPTNWDGPYIDADKKIEDHWGHPYGYRFPSKSSAGLSTTYDLWSYGPDGIESDDDILYSSYDKKPFADKAKDKPDLDTRNKIADSMKTLLTELSGVKFDIVTIEENLEFFAEGKVSTVLSAWKLTAALKDTAIYDDVDIDLVDYLKGDLTTGRTDFGIKLHGYLNDKVLDESEVKAAFDSVRSKLAE